MILAATRDAARLFLELGTVTIVLAVGARLAARTGFSSIPLYLVAGIVLGALAPPTLDDALVTTLSEVGIVLLLFTLGLEYSALEIASGLRGGVRGGIVDVALNFPPGFAVGLPMGWGLVGALVLGGITYVSSSGIVAKVVGDLGRVRNPETPGLLSLLILEDLAMALYLPLIGVLLIRSGMSTAVASAVVALAVVGLIFLLALRHGHFVSRAVWHESDEVLVLSTMGVLLLVAGITERVHVSAAVGGSLLGIALSGPVADRARVLVWAMRDLFAAMFFFFALRIDLGDIPPVLVPAIALIAITCLAEDRHRLDRRRRPRRRGAYASGYRADRPRRVLDRDRRSRGQPQRRASRACACAREEDAAVHRPPDLLGPDAMIELRGVGRRSASCAGGEEVGVLDGRFGGGRRRADVPVGAGGEGGAVALSATRPRGGPSLLLCRFPYCRG